MECIYAKQSIIVMENVIFLEDQEILVKNVLYYILMKVCIIFVEIFIYDIKNVIYMGNQKYAKEYVIWNMVILGRAIVEKTMNKTELI